VFLRLRYNTIRRKFVDMLIDFPKICVTVVQGESHSVLQLLVVFTIILQDCPFGSLHEKTVLKLWFRFFHSSHLAMLRTGPAYGISVTMLGLFDLVYASPTVTFTTPFSTLGICLEGCSSVTFPALLGGPLSTRLLYLAETISIDELVQNSQRMIAEIIPSSSNIQGEVLTKVEKSLEGLSLNSIVASKSLVRSKSVRDRLHQVNREEMTLVQNCMAGEEHKDAIRRFQEKKKAKKEEQGRKTSGGGSKL
jgi:hypothetical protein